MTDDIRRIEPPEMLEPRRGMNRALMLIAAALVFLAAFAFYLQYRSVPFDPAAWRHARGSKRALMLESLLDQTDFIGFTREEVLLFLGAAGFDERLFWYDLGSAQGDPPIDRRGDVGDPSRLFGIFRHNEKGDVIEVIYSHRRPVLGSIDFDSTVWAGASPDNRRSMFTSAMRTLRGRGLKRDVIIELLGAPDGTRVRGEYDVGKGKIPYGSNRALVIQYNRDDVVDTSFVQK